MRLKNLKPLYTREIELELLAEGEDIRCEKNERGELFIPYMTFSVVCNKLYRTRREIDDAKKGSEKWKCATVLLSIVCIVLTVLALQ